MAKKRIKMSLEKELQFHKDLIEMFKVFIPEGNALMYGIFLGDNNPADFTLGYRGDLWGIAADAYQRYRPLIISTNSTIGNLISGQEVFRLYGKFRDYDKPSKASNYRGDFYPIERISAPDTTKEIKLPIDKRVLPVALFVGNVLPGACNEGLVYVKKRFWGLPEKYVRVAPPALPEEGMGLNFQGPAEELHKVLEHR